MSTTTAAQMVAAARAEVRGLTPAGLDELASSGAAVVDLREAAELEEHGSIPCAIHVPRGMLEFVADGSSPYHRSELDPARPVVLFCASGGRSALAGALLRRMGYRDVSHLDGGFSAWVAEGRAVRREPQVAGRR